jgi:hypothetical protein
VVVLILLIILIIYISLKRRKKEKVESNEEITQLPSVNLTREEKEPSEENKMGEFVGEEKVNDCIKAETEKEKGREIIQEQELQTIKNNGIIQSTNNDDNHEENEKKEINKEKPYIIEGCESESLLLEETGSEKENEADCVRDKKEIGKKEIELTIFNDGDTSKTNKTKKKHKDKTEVESQSDDIEIGKSGKRKKQKKQHKEIHLSQDPGISSVLVKEFVDDNGKRFQEQNEHV